MGFRKFVLLIFALIATSYCSEVIKFPVTSSSVLENGTVIRINGENSVIACDEGEEPSGVIISYENDGSRSYMLSVAGIVPGIRCANPITAGEKVVPADGGEIKPLSGDLDGYVMGVALEDGLSGDRIKIMLSIKVSGGGDDQNLFNKVSDGFNTYNAVNPTDQILFSGSGGTDVSVNPTSGVVTIDASGSVDDDWQTGTGIVYNNTDNIGIGTSIPTYLLDVAGDIGLDEYIYHNDNPLTHIRYTNNQMDFYNSSFRMLTLNGTPDPTYVAVNDDGSSNIDFRVESSSDTHLLFADASENKVGIGTTSPLGRFEVEADGENTAIRGKYDASCYGVLGYTASGPRTGVYGASSGSSAAQRGVWGNAWYNGTANYAIRGVCATASSSTSNGYLYGLTAEVDAEDGYRSCGVSAVIHDDSWTFGPPADAALFANADDQPGAYSGYFTGGSMKIPDYTSSSGLATTEGAMFWESDADKLWIHNGGSWQEIGGGSADTDWAYESGSGITGDIYHTGMVAVGLDTVPYQFTLADPDTGGFLVIGKTEYNENFSGVLAFDENVTDGSICGFAFLHDGTTTGRLHLTTGCTGWLLSDTLMTWDRELNTIVHHDLTVLGEIDPISVIYEPQSSAPSAVEGKLYYDNSINQLRYYNGSSWQNIGGGGSDADWTIGSGTVYNNSANIGIGTSIPTYRLDIVSDDATQARITSSGTSPTAHLIIDQSGTNSMVDALRVDNSYLGNTRYAYITSWGTFAFGRHVSGYLGHIGGNSSSDSDAISFHSGKMKSREIVLKPTSTEPTGENGHLYYNSSTNKFRAYENGTWTDLISGGGSSDDDWGYASGTGLSGDIYHTGEISVGTSTVDGAVQGYFYNGSYSRGLIGCYDVNPSTYASGYSGGIESDIDDGQFGVFGMVNSSNPNPVGVIGIYDGSDDNGIGVWGENTESGNYGYLGGYDYAGYFNGNSIFTDNVGIGTTVLSSGKLSIIHSDYTTGIWISNPGHGIEVSGMGGGFDAVRAQGQRYGIYASGNDFAGYFVGDGYFSQMVGIGTTSLLSDLDIDQSGGSASVEGTGGINLRNGSWHWRIYNSSDYVRFNYSNDGGSSYTPKAYVSSIDGSWNALSDRRLKTDIESMEDVLPSVLKLEPKRFHFIDNNENDPKSIGFIAQDVQKLFPEITSRENDEEYLGIAYSKFGIVSIKAIQEQQLIIESQQEQIDAQQKQIEELMRRIEALEND